MLSVEPEPGLGGPEHYSLDVGQLAACGGHRLMVMVFFFLILMIMTLTEFLNCHLKASYVIPKVTELKIL